MGYTASPMCREVQTFDYSESTNPDLALNIHELPCADASK